MLVGAAIALSVAVLALSLAVVPFVIIRLPADYFVRPRLPVRARSRGAARVALDTLRTAAGGLLILVGIAMLVLPGQGVLTIVGGLALLPFPGKRALQRRLLRVRGVRMVVAAIRRQAHKPQLQLEKPVV